MSKSFRLTIYDMKKTLTKFGSSASSCGALLLSLSSQVFSQAIFNFNDGNGLDQNGIGASDTVFDPTVMQNVTIINVEIIGQDGSLASDDNDDDGFPDNIHTTNSTGSANALGINSNVNPAGNNSEARDFDPGEAWIFQFDGDVILNEIDFAGWSDFAEVLITSSAFPDIILTSPDGSGPDLDGDGTGDNTADIFSLGDVTVPANTPITLTTTNTTGDLSLRIDSMTISAVPTVSLGNDLIWNGGLSGDWNLTDINFLNQGTASAFTTDDNVTISSSAAITLDAAGIQADNVTADNAAPTLVNLMGGSLTVNNLAVNGSGNLQLANDTTTGVTFISNGSTLAIQNGGSLVTDSLSLSDNSQFLIESTGSFTNNGTASLGPGGGTINNEADLIFTNISNTILANPLTKTGAGILTLNNGLGTQTTGPVLLNILEGAVRVSGSTSADQINIGGNGPIDEDPISTVLTIAGQLLLDGAVLEVHNAQLAGTGSIIVESPSNIASRFNIGPAQIDLPITLDSELELDPSAGTPLTINGIIDGDSDLVKIGNGDLILTADNTYLGDTIIENGNLQLDTTFLSDASTVTIEGDAILNLTHGSGDTVESFFINGVQVPAGTYGSSAVTGTTLTNVDDTFFTGDGWLIVNTGPVPLADVIIIDCGIDGDNFFIEVNEAAASLSVTSSDTLDFTNATSVNAEVDPNNPNRLLISSPERNPLLDFFRVNRVETP